MNEAEYCVLVWSSGTVVGPFQSAHKAREWIVEDMDCNFTKRSGYSIRPFASTLDAGLLRNACTAVVEAYREVDASDDNNWREICGKFNEVHQQCQEALDNCDHC